MLDKVVKKIHEVGPWGTLRIVANNLTAVTQKLSLSSRKKTREESTFDVDLGVETSSKVEVSDLDVSEERRKHCVCYQPTRIWLFNEILNGLQISGKDYVLVDFGSGKGRVLLLAARYPFKKIIGVEISQQLHELAAENIKRHNTELCACHDISSRCLDAEDFEIPGENVVLYFYNPFDEYVMRRVLSNIEASFRRHQREMILIYINPVHHEVIDGSDFFKIIRKDRRYRVYATKAPL
jgi:tRNA G46 methylase TrmB